MHNLLGSSWEGEAYKVRERRTGALRVGTMFRPKRNLVDRVRTQYAQKLKRLDQYSMVIDYHHTERIRWHNEWLTCMVMAQ